MTGDAYKFTIWLFNIAMENHHAFNRYTIYFYGPAIHGYVK